MENDGIKPIILITTPGLSYNILELLGITCDLIILKNEIPRRENILEKCTGCYGLLWTCTNIEIDEELLDTIGPQLKIIALLTSNCDYIDLNILHERNILYSYTPSVTKNSIAELAIGLMLSASRRFYEGRLAIDKSLWIKWSPTWLLGTDVRGANVGFFGMNDIGLSIAEHLQGFRFGKFLYTNTLYNTNKKWLIQVNFEKLLKECQFIFIICPLTNKTKYLFNSNIFNKMLPNTVLINISNAYIIEQKSLYKALRDKKIFAAGIDSCYPDPIQKSNQLLQLPNLIITPNLQLQTKKIQDELGMIAVENIVNVLNGKEMWSTSYSKMGVQLFTQEFDFEE